jgi:Mitochondrial carrier protein
MLGSVLTKTQLKKMGAPPTVAALAGGLVGGVAQAVIMTPAGLVFTALNNDRQTGTAHRETTWGVVTRVVREKGVAGMFAGGRPMCIRQATNWASRSGFTEIARSVLRLSDYGLLGEIGAGAIGGVGSCWNTPIETIRVYTQRDVSQGKEPKAMAQYWDEIVSESGYPGLFRGVTPRAIQAIWQTVFLVVVPNLMGI